MNCKIEDTNDYTHNQVRLQSFALQSQNKIILENTSFGWPFRIIKVGKHPQDKSPTFQYLLNAQIQ